MELEVNNFSMKILSTYFTSDCSYIIKNISVADADSKNNGTSSTECIFPTTLSIFTTALSGLGTGQNIFHFINCIFSSTESTSGTAQSTFGSTDSTDSSARLLYGSAAFARSTMDCVENSRKTTFSSEIFHYCPR